MKKGDVVTVRDSSYSKIIIGHELKSGYGHPHNIRRKQGTIIEVDCRFPDPHYYQTQGDVCNDVVVILDSGETVFIEERFLEPVLPTHKVMVDLDLRPGYIGGEIIKISDKLYKEIKRDS